MFVQIFSLEESQCEDISPGETTEPDHDYVVGPTPGMLMQKCIMKLATASAWLLIFYVLLLVVFIHTKFCKHYKIACIFVSVCSFM